MLRPSRCASLLLATSALAWSGHSDAGETTTYASDELGRLTRVDHSGTVNNGVQASYSYDPADNRSNVSVSLAGTPPSGPPPGPVPPPVPVPPPLPPSPPGSNQAPTAVDDHGEGRRCQSRDFNVVANDSDPNGDALTVSSVGGDPGFSILSETTVRYANGGSVGSYSATYTIGDGRGGSASATLYVEVPRDQCL